MNHINIQEIEPLYGFDSSHPLGIPQCWRVLERFINPMDGIDCQEGVINQTRTGSILVAFRYVNWIIETFQRSF